MQNVQTIIFDLGGVIINTKSDKEWLEEDLLPVFQRDKLDNFFLQNFFKNFETGKISGAEFIHKLKEIANDDIDSSIETITKHWNGILKDIPAERVELLQRLKTKYTLILLSNTNEIHLEAIAKYMEQKFGKDILEDNFHACYYSHQIGLRKPHKEVYEWVLQKEGLEPASCLYLDDRPENLSEPSKLGMPTLLADRDITLLLADY